VTRLAGTTSGVKPDLLRQLLQELRLVGKRLLMAKQHLAIAHRNHIVMKHAFINHRRILAGENHLPGIDLIQARNRLAGLERLPRRVAQRIIFAPCWRP
jgi:hypothetical protein